MYLFKVADVTSIMFDEALIVYLWSIPDGPTFSPKINDLGCKSFTLVFKLKIHTTLQ